MVWSILTRIIERGKEVNSPFFFSSNLSRLMHNFKFTRSLSALKDGILISSSANDSYSDQSTVKIAGLPAQLSYYLKAYVDVDHMTIT